VLSKIPITGNGQNSTISAANSIGGIDWIINLVAQGVFVGAGVIGGYWFDRHLEQKNEKEQTLRILNLLKLELQENLKMMNTLWAGLIRQRMTYAHFKLDMWKGVAAKIDLIKNVDLLSKLAITYYNFETFERALDLLNTYVATFISQRDRNQKARVLSMVNQHRTVMLDRLGDDGDEDNPTMPYRTRVAAAALQEEIERLDDKRYGSEN
jgi:hypothetical protein